MWCCWEVKSISCNFSFRFLDLFVYLWLQMHEHIQYAPTVWWYENSGQAQIAAGHWWLGGTSTVKTGQDISQPPSALSLSGYVRDTRLQSINQSLSSFNYKVLSPLELVHVFASVTAKQWMSDCFHSVVWKLLKKLLTLSKHKLTSTLRSWDACSLDVYTCTC